MKTQLRRSRILTLGLAAFWAWAFRSSVRTWNGTWVHDSFHGWIWVPGIEWAPAWVYWRVGGGHIGWAPCGPRGVVVAPSAFTFVGISHFHNPGKYVASGSGPKCLKR